MVQVNENLNPYAGEARTEYADDPASRGRTTKTPQAIPGDSLHSAFKGYVDTATSVEPYALKPGNQASDETDVQLNDANTNPGVRDQSNPHVKVAFTNDSSLDVPGDVTPYANEARVTATSRDADGC